MELKDDMDRAQLVFARWLDIGTKSSFVLLLTGFAAYVSGILPPYIQLEKLPQLWGLPLDQFVAATSAPRGWEWLGLAGRGDYFNFVGIAMLGSIVIAAYLRVLPLLAARERVFALIACLEIAVLLTSASGLLNSLSGGSP